MFPIVKYVKDLGPNGRNWPGLVHVRKGLPYPAAVVAQEAWESMHKMDPIKLFHRVFKRSDQDQREFEFMGHEIECQVMHLLYGVRLDSARQSEALSMKGGYDGLFQNMSIARIKMELEARQEKALKWVNKNMKHIRKHK